MRNIVAFYERVFCRNWIHCNAIVLRSESTLILCRQRVTGWALLIPQDDYEIKRNLHELYPQREHWLAKIKSFPSQYTDRITLCPGCLTFRERPSKTLQDHLWEAFPKQACQRDPVFKDTSGQFVEGLRACATSEPFEYEYCRDGCKRIYSARETARARMQKQLAEREKELAEQERSRQEWERIQEERIQEERIQEMIRIDKLNARLASIERSIGRRKVKATELAFFQNIFGAQQLANIGKQQNI